MTPMAKGQGWRGDQKARVCAQCGEKFRGHLLMCGKCRWATVNKFKRGETR